MLLAVCLLCSCGAMDNVEPDITHGNNDSSTASPDTGDGANGEESIKREPDSSLVAAAYLSGDDSKLSDKEKELLDIASGVIAQNVTEEMTDEEKCIVIHDYIVTNGMYDQGALAVIKSQKEYSHIAYGFLTEGEGICSGYADSYKLFMDMLGIENLLIEGEAANDEHKWNLVRIDGEWYHVDCTWDDFVPDEEGRPPFHIYMFLTDDAIGKNHKWNRDDYPKATSTKLNYYKSHGLWGNDASDAIMIVASTMATGTNYAEVALPLPVTGISVDGTLSYWYTMFDDYYVMVFTA